MTSKPKAHAGRHSKKANRNSKPVRRKIRQPAARSSSRPFVLFRDEEADGNDEIYGSKVPDAIDKENEKRR